MENKTLTVPSSRVDNFGEDDTDDDDKVKDCGYNTSKTTLEKKWLIQS